MMAPVTRILAAVGMAATILAGCAQPPARQAAAQAGAALAAANHGGCSRPVYPAQAAANKIEGTTTLGMLIGPDGKVIESRLYASSGDASLDEAARNALSACTFRPAMREGKPVRAWTSVQYVWKMD
jgi:TonB family protein